MREAASFIARQSGADAVSVVDTLFKAVSRMVRTLHNRRRVMSLDDLDDHMLRDLGLARGDVQRALDVPFAQDPSLELQRLALRNCRRGWRT